MTNTKEDLTQQIRTSIAGSPAEETIDVDGLADHLWSQDVTNLDYLEDETYWGLVARYDSTQA